MRLHLQSSGTGYSSPRPVIRLAAGTLLARMDTDQQARCFRGLADFALSIRMIRLEQAGLDVPMDSPLKPGRVGHRKSDGLLTIDIQYNEINMVLDRICRDQPDGRTIPASRDYLDTFIERLETAMVPLSAWCDRNEAWQDRDHYDAQWSATKNALMAGDFHRPYEFALTPLMRDALDASWSLCEAEILTSERYDDLGEAYFRLRDAGWQDAEYVTDPSQASTQFGQPAKLANFSANLATAAPPDDSVTYSIV